MEVFESNKIPDNLQPLTLRLTDWKDYFLDSQCKLMLAKGLNYCIHSNGMRVVGYLMTNKNLFLILRNKGEVQDLMHLLDEYLKIEIHNQLRLRRMLLGKDDEEIDFSWNEELRATFERFPLINQDLIKALSGIPFEKRYYSAEIERIKDLTENNNFCSAPHYENKDWIGPVELDIESWEILIEWLKVEV
jgi:hypothetical protein